MSEETIKKLEEMVAAERKAVAVLVDLHHKAGGGLTLDGQKICHSRYYTIKRMEDMLNVVKEAK